LNAKYSITQINDGFPLILKDEFGLVDLKTQIKAKEGLVGVFEGLAIDAEVEHRRVSESESGVYAKVTNHYEGKPLKVCL